MAKILIFPEHPTLRQKIEGRKLRQFYLKKPKANPKQAVK